jgi:hypothetical protein
MKTIFLSLLLICLSFQAEAQKKNSGTSKNKNTNNSKGLPVLVENAFKKDYPSITKKELNYEAQYEEKFIQHHILYSPKGKLIHTAVSISVGALPHAVSSYAAIHYPEYMIIEALKIKSATNVISYEVAVDSVYLFFDGTGNFISEKKRTDPPVIK